MKIRKTKGTAILNGNVVDSLEENSTTNAPSQRAVNDKVDEVRTKKEVLWEGTFKCTTQGEYSYFTIDKNVYDYDFLLADVSAGNGFTDRITSIITIEGKGVTCGCRGDLHYLIESYMFCFGVQTDGLNKIGFMVKSMKNYTLNDVKLHRIIGIKL